MLKSPTVSHTLVIACCAFINFAKASEDLLSIYRLASEHDPTWQAAIAQATATKTRVPQGWSALLPALNWQGHANQQHQRTLSGRTFGDTDSSTRFKSYDSTFSLKQPIMHLGYWLQLKQAYASSEEAEQTVRAEKMALMTRAAERYFSVLNAKNALSFAKAEKKAIQKQLEDAKARFDVGALAITDVQEAQARDDLATTQVLEAQNLLDNALEQLKEITGKDTPLLKNLKKEVPLQEPLPNQLDHWMELSLAQNPAILSGEAANKVATQEVWKKRSEHLPTLNLVGTSAYNDTGGRFGALKTRDDTIGLELTFPLFQGGGVLAKTNEALANKEAARQSLIKARRTTESQVKQSFLGVLSSISRVKALQQAVVSSKKALEATRAGYEVGTRSIVDVLNAERDTFRTERDYEQTRITYLLNALKLKQAAGILLEDDIAQVTKWLE